MHRLVLGPQRLMVLGEQQGGVPGGPPLKGGHVAAPRGLLGGTAINTGGWELAGSGSNIHTSCITLG
jgi:hypothetical protein